MKENLKKLLRVFLWAFLLNAIWENLHSLLYVHYKSGAITEFILLRATLSDAVFITLAAVLILVLHDFKWRMYLAAFILLTLSIYIEAWALQSGRWAYKEIMPLVPFLNTGLTPTVQLALLGLLSFKLSDIARRENN